MLHLKIGAKKGGYSLWIIRNLLCNIEAIKHDCFIHEAFIWTYILKVLISE